MSEITSSDTGPGKERKRLFTTFAYLVAKQGATAGLGLVYWVFATQLFPARDIGLAAAAASTVFFLGTIGALGIPIFLLAELDSIEAGKRRVMFTTGMAITCFVVLVLSLAALALSPDLGTSLKTIGRDPTMAVFFVIGGVATVAGITFDNTAIGLHRGSAQLVRGSLASVLKLLCVIALVLAGSRTSAGLLFAWAATLAVSLAVCVPMLRLSPGRAGEGSLRHRGELVRRYGTLSLKHHVLNLSINSISYIVPLTAALFIRPQQVAYFTTAFMLSAAVLVIPYLLALALFAENANDAELLHRHVRRTLPLGLVLCGLVVLVVEVAAPFALRVFGPSYSANGTTPLRLLILVGPAYVIKDHYVAIRRAQRRLTDAAKIMAIGTSVEAVGAALGCVFWGMDGLCAGWAIAASGEALLLSPEVFHIFRRPPVVESDPGTRANSWPELRQ